MFRLTLILCAAMLVALYTLGEDRGQTRPWLAKAQEEARLDALAKADAAPVAEAAPIAEADVPAPEPLPEVAEVAEVARPDPAPPREVVQVLADPVFTLSAVGNEPVPGENGAPVTTAAVTPDSRVWYVNASSVNVRAEPSTEGEILGRLANGEAALVVAEVNDEWARIVIEGDGLEGYVAVRFLSPQAP
jgi:cytoskeletal protein RodZ